MKIQELKILELASVLAGPQVGSFFSELGASVIKIENQTTQGDVTRNWKLKTESVQTRVSAYYASTNYDKEVLFLDFNEQDDLGQIHELIQQSDVVISNFKPGAGKKFGLDYESVKSINPEIIYGEITGFGEQSTRPAFDVILQAETGYLSMTGTDLNNLAKLPVAFIDLFAAHQLKEGILVALAQQQKPARVSVSLYDSAIAALANQASNFLMAGHVPQPVGTQHPNIAPYGDIFTSADDKKLALAIGTEKHFVLLLELLQLPMKPGFKKNADRVRHRTELIAFLAPQISKFDREEFLTQCTKLGIPAGAVLNLEEVFENQEAKKLILNEEIEGVETKKVKSAVFTISS